MTTVLTKQEYFQCQQYAGVLNRFEILEKLPVSFSDTSKDG